jgi:phage-related protein
MAGKNVVANAIVTIIPSMKGSRAEIKREMGVAVREGAASAGSAGGAELGSKLGQGLSTAKLAISNALGNIISNVASRAVEGLKNVFSTAFNNYADYEHLVGGVETLFKSSSDTVQRYASNAFRDAGMSANEYMETITGFSASLIQSLGGDTAKAAELGNQAVIDMSDNANKMGTDLGALQFAYQGFAKQNYTMLDNLSITGARAA